MGKNRACIAYGLLILAGAVLVLLAGCAGGEPQDVKVAVTIRDDRMSPDTIQVKHGDTVTLKIDSDTPGAFHLHGYDIEQGVQPGEVADFAFTADATGRYRIAFHKTGNDGASGHGHGEPSDESGHGSMSHDAIESEVPVGVEVSAAAEPGGGVNVFIETENWRWAPEEVNKDHSPGAGHAHVYVDGVKVNRVYGPAYHLTGLSPGTHEVRVSLTANAHNVLLVNGEPVEDTITVTVGEHQGTNGGNIEPAAAETPMSVEAMVHPDAVDGHNLRAMTSGFTFTPGNAGKDHVDGEGYGRILIDGEEFARLYNSWFKLPALEPGAHQVTVALYTNDHRPYTWDGTPVETVVELEARGEMEQMEHHGPAESGDEADSSASPIETEIDLGFLEVHPR